MDSKVVIGGIMIGAKNEDVVGLIKAIKKAVAAGGDVFAGAKDLIKDLELDAGIGAGTGDDLFDRVVGVLGVVHGTEHKSLINRLCGAISGMIEAAEPPVKTFEQQADDFKAKLEAALQNYKR